MPAIETAAISLAKMVVGRVALEWLAYRRDRDGSSRELSDLLALRFRDRFVRRKIELQFESMMADIAERVVRSFGPECASLPANEVPVALEVVGRTFDPEARTDEVLFASNADPTVLAARLRPPLAANAVAAGLSEAATRLAELVLVDCVRCYVEMVRGRPDFNNRANQEQLARLSRISVDVAEILSRLPAAKPVEEAPGQDGDAAVARYLRFVSTHHDQLELFGVDVRNYTPETTLTVAYLSLAVSGAHGRAPFPTDRRRYPVARGSFFRKAKDDLGDERMGLRVEAALGQAGRILVRGEAGSGKSTLLRWLAIRAARGEFTGDLHEWNGRIPFLVKLRSYADRNLPPVGNELGDDLAQMSAGLSAGWVERVFAQKRALLLVDGVDELVRSQRPGVRQWLRRILNQYPDTIVVVTSRPTAAPARWLTGEGFTALMLERMTPADIVVFVQRWHRAISGARHLPCERADLPRYERRLIARLDANHHLRGLATNPLMCAMLCALNLDRTDDLPHDRLSLYRAALEMLLERRDTARNVPAYRRIALGAQHAMSLLQDLAWRLAIAGQAELDTEQARAYVTRKLATMPKVNADPADVFEHLLDRSGVLKDVAEDRLSFVHRTFQEYLAAKEIAEENYIDVLVQQASRDMWRETVIMTAGLASSEYRQRLISGLLDRAETAAARQARWLRLLAGACVETAPALTPAVLDRIDENLTHLVPPRSVVEARSLALAGERVIDLLPDDLTALSENAARAVINTIAYVGGPRALRKLAQYSADDRVRVVHALIDSASHFEPEEYGRTVLAESPLRGILVRVDDWTAPMLPHLRHLDGVSAYVDDPENLLRALPPVRRLRLWRGTASAYNDRILDLGILASQHELEELYLDREVQPQSIPGSLAALKHLYLRSISDLHGPASLSWVSRLPRLTTLQLSNFVKPRSFRPLAELTQLTSLTLTAGSSPRALSDVAFLHRLPTLNSLGLNGCSDPRVLEHVVAAQPDLNSLRLMRLHVPDLNLATIAELPLTLLDLDSFEGVLDLQPLAGHPTLQELDLSRCRRLGDLSPLASVPSLRDLYLQEVPGLDLAPLAGLRRLTVWAMRGQPLRNAACVRVRRW